MNPIVFSLVRDLLAFPILLFAGIRLEGFKRLTRKDFPMFMVLGLTGIYGNQICYILGLYLTSPSIAAIIQPSIPVFTTILAIVTRMEAAPSVRDRAGLLKILGILFATGGALAMVLTTNRDDNDNDDDDDDDDDDSVSSSDLILGNVFLIANCLSISIYILLQKKFIFGEGAKRSDWRAYPISVTAWCYGTGSCCIALTCVYHAIFDRDAFHLPTETVYSLLYAVLITSSLCYGLMTFANKHAPSTIVTAFWPLQVPVAVGASYLVFGELITVGQGLGAVGIASGLLCVTYSNHIVSMRTRNENQESLEYMLKNSDDSDEETVWER